MEAVRRRPNADLGAVHRKCRYLRGLLPIQLMQQTRTSMVKRGTLSTIGVLIQGLVRLLTTVTIGRIGGPSVLGTFSTGLSTAQLAVLFGPTSVGNARSKFVARARGAEDGPPASAVAAQLSKRAMQSSILVATISAVIWIGANSGGIIDSLALGLLILGFSGSSYTRGIQFGAHLIPRATASFLSNQGPR